MTDDAVSDGFNVCADPSIVASRSAVVQTKIHRTCSVEIIQETIERDVVLGWSFVIHSR